MAPRCQCGAATCACSVVGGDGIDVTGVGTQANPYRVINLRGDPLSRLQVIDSDSVDLTIAPVAPDDPDTPYTLQADATVSMMDLTDVNGADFPATGDIPVWDGTEWQFQQPGPSLPPGGADGQVLTKQSSANGDANWETIPPSLPPGGTDGQALLKQSSTDGDALWETIPATAFQVQDTATLDLNLIGSGSLAAPYVLSGTVLGGSGGGGGGVAQPTYTSARRTGVAQSFANSAWVQVTWEIDEYTDGIVWNGTDSFIIPASGYYRIEASVHWASGTTGNRAIRVMTNGGSVNGQSAQTGASSVGGSSAQMATTLKLSAGDVIAIQAMQGSGATVLLTTSSQYNFFKITKVPSGVVGGVVAEGVYASSRRHSAAVTLANNANVPIPYDTEDFTSQIPWDAANNRFTIPVSGYYNVNAKAVFSSENITGYRQLRIYVNGSSATAGQFNGVPQTGTQPSVGVSRLLKLTAGDTVQIVAIQNSGATLTLVAALSYTSVDIVKVPETQSGATGPVTVGEKTYSSSRGHAASTSINNSTWTVIPFDTDLYTENMVWDAANNQFNIQVDGYYSVTAVAQFATHATGYRNLAIYKNAVVHISATEQPLSANPTSLTASATIKCVPGDYITVRIWQNSGGALTLNGSTQNINVSITKVPKPTVYGLEMSGTWGSPPLDVAGQVSTDGQPIYLDTTGKLRAQPAAVQWKSVVDPTTDVRPAAKNVMWIGGATKPVNMVAGDLWVKA